MIMMLRLFPVTHGSAAVALLSLIVMTGFLLACRLVAGSSNVPTPNAISLILTMIAGAAVGSTMGDLLGRLVF